MFEVEHSSEREGVRVRSIRPAEVSNGGIALKGVMLGSNKYNLMKHNFWNVGIGNAFKEPEFESLCPLHDMRCMKHHDLVSLREEEERNLKTKS